MERYNAVKMLLSIIIPVYKVEQYIRQCLDSIISGIDDTVEVIVVDDGSPDASGQIADQYAENYSFVKVIHKQNAGVAAARNTGIGIARGEWLYFVDSDDWLVSDGIEKICAACRENESADVIMMDAWQVTGDNKKPWEHFADSIEWQKKEEIRTLQRGMLYFQSVDRKLKVPLAAPWDKIYKRRFLDENGLFFQENLKVLDDMVFNMQVFGKADRVAYVKEKIYNYRYVPDSITNTYKPDRVELDRNVWSFLHQYASEELSGPNWKQEEKETFLQALYCRIIKSFSICCRLCFFNRQNEKKLTQKLRYVKEIMVLEPYKSAFEKVHLKNAEWRLKPVIIFARWRWSFGVYCLYTAQCLLLGFKK